MNSNYEYVFFKYLYNKLELYKLDEYLFNEKIKMIDPDDVEKRISKYFALENSGDFDLFSNKNNITLNSIFNNELDDILNNKYEEAVAFVEKTYQDYFHLNDDFQYKYYGPTNNEYLAPSNCIVIGLNYVKFNLESDNYDEESERQERIIVRVLNYIQNELAKNNNMKLASLAYNEFTLSQPFVRL